MKNFKKRIIFLILSMFVLICLSAPVAFAIDVHMTAYKGNKMVDDVRVSWQKTSTYHYKVQCPSLDSAYLSDYALKRINYWRSQGWEIWMTHRGNGRRDKICSFR